MHERSQVQALSSAVGELRSENKRLGGVQTSMQDSLRMQSVKISELLEDNCRLTQELETVDDQKKDMERRAQALAAGTSTGCGYCGGACSSTGSAKLGRV